MGVLNADGNMKKITVVFDRYLTLPQKWYKISPMETCMRSIEWCHVKSPWVT